MNHIVTGLLPSYKDEKNKFFMSKLVNRRVKLLNEEDSSLRFEVSPPFVEDKQSLFQGTIHKGYYTMARRYEFYF